METDMTATSAFFFDLGGTLLRLEEDEIWKDKDGQVELLFGVEDELESVGFTP